MPRQPSRTRTRPTARRKFPSKSIDCPPPVFRSPPSPPATMPPSGSNPLEPVFQTVAAFSRRLLIAPDTAPDDHRLRPLLSLSLSPPPPPPSPSEVLKEKDAKVAPLTQKEEVGRATWMLLHTIAAQMALISRLYPCKECADHFKEVLKANPVQAGSQAEFSQWLCYVHNVVNRSLGKTIFPCQRVNARWGKLDCPERLCDLEGANDIMPNR